jgi:uncharacterized protein
MSSPETSPLAVWRERLRRQAEGEAEDASHDVHHCDRVWVSCQRIAEAEASSADLLVLLAAAYLHDIVSPPKDSPQRRHASVLSAERAALRLEALGFPREKLGAVRHAIEAHSFSAGIPPETEEARILQDADRLEALGAIGLARVFYVAGRLGSQLFDPEDPMAERRPLDDRRFAVDHFREKLLKLPEQMNTGAGARLAQKRAAILERYLDDLAAELR